MKHKAKKKPILHILKELWQADFWLRFLTVTSVMLIVTSFFTPPHFVVDSSVMLATGELEIFAVIWEADKALTNNYETKLKIKQIELSIDPNKDDSTDESGINISEDEA